MYTVNYKICVKNNAGVINEIKKEKYNMNYINANEKRGKIKKFINLQYNRKYPLCGVEKDRFKLVEK